MQPELDCVVIGAGVIGLAIARALSRQGRDVIVLEHESVIGSGASSRNSEVLHAGIYDLPEKNKARFCVQGRDLLRTFMDKHSIDYQTCGKLILASGDSRLAALKSLYWNAKHNQVSGIHWLTAPEVLELEPNVSAAAALFSKSSAILDSHGVMVSLLAEAQAHHAQLLLGQAVGMIDINRQGLVIEMSDGFRIGAKCVINAAGMGALKLLSRLTIPKPDKLYLVKGNYFSYSGSKPFRHLVYPLPEAGGLGIHATLDLSGQIRFGPDVEPLEHYNLNVDANRKEQFVVAIQSYYPGLEAHRLIPDYAGIRIKLNPGSLSSDFSIQGPSWHGVNGLVNLFGIESPGLTASLAIAQKVAGLV